MGAFAELRGLPTISTTALWRALFNTGPGPDAGGEKPGPSVFDHSREKSGADAALWVVVLAALATGAASCPKAGAVAAAANVANKRKSRCLCIAQLLLVIQVPSPSRAPIAWLVTPVTASYPARTSGIRGQSGGGHSTTTGGAAEPEAT